MPHKPGHVTYVFYGTNDAYTGRVLQIGNRFYGTNGGALEGDSPLLTRIDGQTTKTGGELSTMYTTPMSNNTTNNNPVTDLFTAPTSPRYYRPDGTMVPVGAPLHRHQDGTIMTEHSMGPNDNSVVVTIQSPQGRTSANMSTMTQTAARTNTRTNGRNGGTRGGGTMGGGRY